MAFGLQCKRANVAGAASFTARTFSNNGSGNKKPDSAAVQPSSSSARSQQPRAPPGKKFSSHPLDMNTTVSLLRFAETQNKEKLLSVPPLAFQKSLHASTKESHQKSAPALDFYFKRPSIAVPTSSAKRLALTPLKALDSPLERASEGPAKEAVQPVFSSNRHLQPPQSSLSSCASSSVLPSSSKCDDPSFVYNFGPMRQGASLSESFFGSWASEPQASLLSASDRRLSKYERESLERKRLEGRDDIIHLMPAQSYDAVLQRALRPRAHLFSKDIERAMSHYDFTVVEELFDLPAIASSVAGSLSRQTIAKLREFQMPVLPRQVEESLSREFFTFLRVTDWQAYRPPQPSFPTASHLIQAHLFYEMAKRKMAFQAGQRRELAAQEQEAAKAAKKALLPQAGSSSPSMALKKGSSAKGSQAAPEPAMTIKAAAKKALPVLCDTAADVQARRDFILAETDTMMREIATGDYVRHGQPSRLLLASTGSSEALRKIQNEHSDSYRILLSAAKALGQNPSLHPSMKADSLRIIQDILLTGASSRL